MNASEHYVRVTHDYEMPGDGYLPIVAAEVLLVLEADKSGWWLGKNTKGKVGVFPSTYVERHVFPAPPDELHAEMSLIHTARSFGLELTSGAPIPMCSFANLTFAATAAAKITSIDELFTFTNECILAREQSRTEVLRSLKALTQSTDAQSSTATSLGSVNKAVEEVRRELARSEYSVQEQVGIVANLRQKCIEQGTLPPPRFYREMMALSPKSATSWEELMLGDTTAVVRSWDKKLTTMAEAATREEAAYYNAKEQVHQRILLRDALVSAMLLDWSSKAKSEKQHYMKTKLEFERLGCCLQAEVKKLENAISTGRERYIALHTQLQESKVTVKHLKGQLQRRAELQQLESQIASINDTLRQAKAASVRR